MNNLTKTILLATSIGAGAVGLSIAGNGIKTEAQRMYLFEKGNSPIVKESYNNLMTYGEILHASGLFTCSIAAPLVIYRHNKRRKI